MNCAHRAIRSWSQLDGSPVQMWSCVDCGWMFDPRSDTTEHSTNRSADSAESFHKRTSVTCTHGWFRTGAMKHGEMRCIHCGIWNEYPIDTSTKRRPMLMTVGDTLERAGFMKRPEPLTEEAIAALLSQSAGIDIKLNGGDLLFARAIEKAHGIGGEK